MMLLILIHFHKRQETPLNLSDSLTIKLKKGGPNYFHQIYRNGKDIRTTPIRDKRILIMDDDYYFRLTLEHSLKFHQHLPTCAENAKHAQQLMGLEKFDLVISDIRMSEMNGLELMRWIKANYPTPVILMTGFSDLVETQDAAKSGAHGFLAKPFKTEDLMYAIQACFPDIHTKEKSETHDKDFCKVSIDDFVTGKEMRYDIYIKIDTPSMLRICFPILTKL